MQRFAETCEAVSATTSKKEKVRLLGEYLRSLPVEDAARAALFLTGLPFPRAGEKVLGVGGSLVWQAVSRLVDPRAHTLQDVYRKHGDLGSMTEELLAGKKPVKALSLADL